MLRQLTSSFLVFELLTNHPELGTAASCWVAIEVGIIRYHGQNQIMGVERVGWTEELL